MTQSTQVNCDNKFVLCHGQSTEPETFSVANLRSGEHNQWLCVISGVGQVNQQTLAPGVVDLSSQYGKSLTYTISASSSEWIAINPIPYRRKLTVQHLENPTTLTPAASCILVCANGAITANTKEIPKLHYAKLLAGTEYSINIPPGALALLVYY